jgi:hypothetical protein
MQLVGNQQEPLGEVPGLQLLLRELELHVLVLAGDLSIHMVHRVQLLLKEQSELHFLLVLQEVLLVLLEDLVSTLLLLTLGASQFIIELA